MIPMRKSSQLATATTLTAARVMAALLVGGLTPLVHAQNCTTSINPVTPGPTLDSIQAIGAGDFNGDGRADLVTLNSNPPRVDIRFSLGNGAFSPPVPNALASFSSPNRMLVTDLTGDGFPDVYVELFDNNATCSVLIGAADGTLTPGLETRLPFRSSAVGDLNGDGRPDLVGFFRPVGGPVSDDLVVWLNEGGGQFTLAPVSNTGSNGRIALADLNNDSRLDVFLVLAGTPGQFQCIYQGAPANPGDLGAFTAAAPTAPASGSLSISGDSLALLDVNGDAKLDVLLASNSAFLTVYDQIGAIGDALLFSGRREIDPVDSSAAPIGLSFNFTLADVNLDGRADLLRHQLDQGATQSVLRVKFGLSSSIPGGNSLSNLVTLPATDFAGLSSSLGVVTTVTVADFSGDGSPDIYVEAPTPLPLVPLPGALFQVTRPGDLVIQTAPAARRISAGQDTTLAVVAQPLDGVSALGYQWLKNGVALVEGSASGRITGVHTPTLSIADAQASDSGVFTVNVTTGCATRSASAYVDCSEPCGDIDRDGDVDLVDLAILLSNFGGICP